jgi:hypothetical protein
MVLDVTGTYIQAIIVLGQNFRIPAPATVFGKASGVTIPYSETSSETFPFNGIMGLAPTRQARRPNPFVNQIFDYKTATGAFARRFTLALSRTAFRNPAPSYLDLGGDLSTLDTDLKGTLSFSTAMIGTDRRPAMAQTVSRYHARATEYFLIDSVNNVVEANYIPPRGSNIVNLDCGSL